jgi:6-pyruvoyltetrahydropterin/6-carboxytetrahydropterin synthase
VRVHVEADALDELGMVIDFHELDRIMEEVIEPFEHRHLNDVSPFDEINPSSENLARFIGEGVKKQLTDARVRVQCCEVWENDLSRARYFLD